MASEDGNRSNELIFERSIKPIGLSVLTMFALGACTPDLAVKTFSDATRNVNEDFRMGQQLRDRCNATQNIDHCKAWLDYKRAEEAENPLMDYEKALARWEERGPY